MWRRCRTDAGLRPSTRYTWWVVSLLQTSCGHSDCRRCHYCDCHSLCGVDSGTCCYCCYSLHTNYSCVTWEQWLSKDYLHIAYRPSVLWRCWLGGRKGIWPVKTEWWGDGMLSVWSEVQTCIRPSWCHCHSLSLASVKSRLVLPFWYRLNQVILDKGPLNGCVCMHVCIYCRSKRQPCVTICPVNYLKHYKKAKPC